MPRKQPTVLMRIDDFHTEKPLCPHCGQDNSVVRNGVRTTKSGPVQVYLCRRCSKQFSDRRLKNVVYPPHIILRAISYFNTGHTYDRTRRFMSRRYKTKIPISTLKTWTDNYVRDFPFIKHRKYFTLDPKDTIRTRHFSTPDSRGTRHDFKVHTLKLNMAGKSFPALKVYINQALNELPDYLFQSPKSLRISELARQLPTPSTQPVIRGTPENNAACRMTNLALELCQTKRERHPVVEEFFLINDIATVAIEVPLWLTAEEAWNLGLPGETITGHIDMLQFRNDKLYVLDYKPEPTTKEYAMTQLDLYAKALGIRTGFMSGDLNLAYFNEREYVEISHD